MFYELAIAWGLTHVGVSVVTFVRCCAAVSGHAAQKYLKIVFRRRRHISTWPAPRSHFAQCHKCEYVHMHLHEAKVAHCRGYALIGVPCCHYPVYGRANSTEWRLLSRIGLA